MDEQNDIRQTISFWVGYVEEANKSIDAFKGATGGLFRHHLQIAQQKRDEGLAKIAELGGKADLILRLSKGQS